MAGQYINAILRHPPMSESHIAAKLNRDRESIFVTDFVPNTVGYSGTDLEKSTYIMAYEYGDVVRKRRNLTTLELLKSGAAHPNAGASNIYIDAEKTDYRTMSGTAVGLSSQKAIEQLDNGIVLKDLKDSDVDDSKGNSISIGSTTCAVINGSNNEINGMEGGGGTPIQDAVIITGNENLANTDNEVVMGGNKVLAASGTSYVEPSHAQISNFVLTAYRSTSDDNQDLFLTTEFDHIVLPTKHLGVDVEFAAIGGTVTITGLIEDGDEALCVTGLFSFAGVYGANGGTTYVPDVWQDMEPIDTIKQNKTGGSSTVTTLTARFKCDGGELKFRCSTDAGINLPVTWVANVQLNKTLMDTVA
jgi:hypothetical protein